MSEMMAVIWYWGIGGLLVIGGPDAKASAAAEVRGRVEMKRAPAMKLPTMPT